MSDNKDEMWFQLEVILNTPSGFQRMERIVSSLLRRGAPVKVTPAPVDGGKAFVIECEADSFAEAFQIKTKVDKDLHLCGEE